MAIEFRREYVIISEQTKDTGGYNAYATAASDFLTDHISVFPLKRYIVLRCGAK
jgi:hypothetical protein